MTTPRFSDKELQELQSLARGWANTPETMSIVSRVKRLFRSGDDAERRREVTPRFAGSLAGRSAQDRKSSPPFAVTPRQDSHDDAPLQ